MRISTLILLATTLLTLASCSHHNDGVGKIVVSQANPFSRERLINSREREISWLEKELEKDVQPTFQGYRSYKVSTNVSGSVSVEVNPLKGLENKSQAQTLKSQNVTADLKEQIKQAALKNYLDQVNNGTISPQAALAFINTSSATKGTNNSAPGSSAGMKNYSTATPSTMGYGTDETRSQLTSIEAINDKKALRDTLNRYIREYSLDDSHDLDGMTLKTLNFDITPMPADRNSAYGIVKLKFGNYSANNMNRVDAKMYAKWKINVTKRLNEEMISIQQRCEMGFLADSERADLIQKIINEEYKIKNAESALSLIYKVDLGSEDVNDENYKKFENKIMDKMHALGPTEGNPAKSSLKIDYGNRLTTVMFLNSRFKLKDTFKPVINLLKTYPNYCSSRDDSPPATTDEKSALKWVLAFLIRGKYLESLSDYIDLDGSIDEVDGWYVLAIDDSNIKNNRCNDYHCNKFVTYLTDLNQKIKPYVISAEPKNYNQNISDLATRKNAINLALELQAMIPNAGVGVGVGAGYARTAEKQLDAILRKPLIVGYADGLASFGWVVGPRFELDDDGKVAFSHNFVNHSVTATAIIPGWWDGVNLDANTGWIDGKGQIAYGEQSSQIQQRLVQDLNSITAHFVEKTSAESQSPILNPRWDIEKDKQIYVLASGKSENLMIRGTNLWKNPQVYIGSQRADSITILPDMKGLVASFNEVYAPSSIKDNLAIVDLAVFTSNGSATLRNAIKIVKAPYKNPDLSKLAFVDSKYVVKGGTITLGLNKNMTFPSSYVGFSVKLRTNKNNAWVECEDFVPQVKEDTFMIKIKPKDDNAIAVSPALVEVGLFVKLSPISEPIAILSGNPQIVYFNTAAETHMSLIDTTVVFQKGSPTPNKIRLKFPLNDPEKLKLFKQAYGDTFSEKVTVLASDESDAANTKTLLANTDAMGNLYIDSKQLTKLKPTKEDIKFNLKIMGKKPVLDVSISPMLTTQSK
jgi:hypothetical protein